MKNPKYHIPNIEKNVYHSVTQPYSENDRLPRQLHAGDGPSFSEQQKQQHERCLKFQ